jgi:hypothetical protein
MFRENKAWRLAEQREQVWGRERECGRDWLRGGFEGKWPGEAKEAACWKSLLILPIYAAANLKSLVFTPAIRFISD